jgi:recombination protein RecT
MTGTQTVTGAVAVRDNSPAGMIEQYRAEYALVLPSHVKPESWVRVVQGLVRRDKKLAQAAQADPASLIIALMDAARQGLEPGTEQFYLRPVKIKGNLQIQGIRGYQGEIELIYRAGAVATVIAEVVREGDLFIWRPGAYDTQEPPRWRGPMERPLHEADWFADRGKLIGVYAYAIMKEGGATSKVVVLNQADIDLAKKSSDGVDSVYSPWRNHEAAMWLKTAAHRLQKWVPTSAEYMREQLRAIRDVSAEPARPRLPDSDSPPPPASANVDTETGEVVEAEVVDDEPASGDGTLAGPGWPEPPEDAR